MSAPGQSDTSWPYGFDVTLTWLDAINLMLASVAAEEVNDPDPALDSDVAMASKWLNAKDLEVQARGWSWNSSENVILTPDKLTGFISLPENTLGVNAAYWANFPPNQQILNPGINPLPITPPCGAPALVAQRGLRLWDQIANTYTFQGPLQVDLIIRLPFTEMPNVARMVATMKATKSFQAAKQGANIVYQCNIDDIRTAEAALEHNEDRARPANSIGGNLNAMRSIYGSGVRRNRGVF